MTRVSQRRGRKLICTAHRADFHTEVTEMGIEPLGSVMSVQAQSNVSHKTAAPAEKPADYSTANVQPAEKLDSTTSVVENTQGKDQSGNKLNNSAEQGTEQQATNEQIRKAVEQLNKSMVSHSEAIFGIHEATNRVTIKIIDKNTKEVIKELPPEKTLDMIAKVWEMAGIMVDERR